MHRKNPEESLIGVQDMQSDVLLEVLECDEFLDFCILWIFNSRLSVRQKGKVEII